jgi:hypothetical protein
MNFFVSAATATAALALLAACQAGPASSGGPICPQSIVINSLVYPAPGSTGIPDAVNVLVVGGVVHSLTLQPNAGAAIVTVTPTAIPNPIPSPNSTPLFATAAFTVPVLAAATTYTVTANAPAAGPCPGQQPQALGAFTTQ